MNEVEELLLQQGRDRRDVGVRYKPKFQPSGRCDGCVHGVLYDGGTCYECINDRLVERMARLERVVLMFAREHRGEAYETWKSGSWKVLAEFVEGLE